MISKFTPLKKINLPVMADVRVMMMPFVLRDATSLPHFLSHWQETLNELAALTDAEGVAYLTIDEKIVPAGQTHRRGGLHVDGVYKGDGSIWGGGGGWGGGSWGGRGFLTVSNKVGCQAWNQVFNGYPGDEGECEHFRPQLKQATQFAENTVYHVDGLCVHESIPLPVETRRQFVRVSLPSTAPWFDGYTENPKGILPTGPILPRREFMNV